MKLYQIIFWSFAIVSCIFHSFGNHATGIYILLLAIFTILFGILEFFMDSYPHILYTIRLSVHPNYEKNMPEEKSVYKEEKASPELQQFFNRLLEIKKFVKERSQGSQDPLLEDIYQQLHSLMKQEGE